MHESFIFHSVLLPLFSNFLYVCMQALTEYNELLYVHYSSKKSYVDIKNKKKVKKKNKWNKREKGQWRTTSCVNELCEFGKSRFFFYFVFVCVCVLLINVPHLISLKQTKNVLNSKDSRSNFYPKYKRWLLLLCVSEIRKSKKERYYFYEHHSFVFHTENDDDDVR